ncbi:MAG: DUF2007 domain-containing protein [Planctomycetota bacterium]|nr:DUF2007 domain-containing protein [Planctomycetota bacterium]
MNHRDPDELATLLRAHTPFEAHTLAAVLADAGIEAFVFDSAYAGFGLSLVPGKGGVPLQVRRGDVEQARRVIRENASDSIDIDWAEVDVGERADTLPLHRPDRMPMLARLAFAVTVLVLLAGLAAGLVILLTP